MENETTTAQLFEVYDYKNRYHVLRKKYDITASFFDFLKIYQVRGYSE